MNGIDIAGLKQIRREVLDALGGLKGEARSDGICFLPLQRRCPSKPGDTELRGVLKSMTKRGEILRVDRSPPAYRLPIGHGTTTADQDEQPHREEDDLEDLEDPPRQKDYRHEQGGEALKQGAARLNAQKSVDNEQPGKNDPGDHAGTVSERILQMLAHGPKSGKEIHQVIGASCYNSISRLSHEGKIVSPGRQGGTKIWALATTDPADPPPEAKAKPAPSTGGQPNRPPRVRQSTPSQPDDNQASPPAPARTRGPGQDLLDAVSVEPSHGIPSESEFNLAIEKLRVQQLLGSLERHAESGRPAPVETVRELRRRLSFT